jgi:hypothetical protein
LGTTRPIGKRHGNAGRLEPDALRYWRPSRQAIYGNPFFDSATRPNTFWVSLDKLNLKPGAPVRKLTLQNGEVFAGEVAGQFKDADPFKFLPATP